MPPSIRTTARKRHGRCAPPGVGGRFASKLGLRSFLPGIGLPMQSTTVFAPNNGKTMGVQLPLLGEKAAMNRSWW